MIKYVDKLLTFTWGHWQRKGSSVISSYPSMDVSQTLNTGGRGTGLNIDRNMEAEYLEKIILTLPRNQIRSLKARYVWCDPDWYAAEKFKIGESTHRDRVYKAQENIHNYLQDSNPFDWREEKS